MEKAVPLDEGGRFMPEDRSSEQAKRTSAKAVASLILGIMSLLGFGCFIFGAALGSVAMLLGYSAILDMRRGVRAGGKGYARAGIILGAASTAWALVVGVLVLLGAMMPPSWPGR